MGEFLASVCPHDCPSACALEVEKLDEYTIGKVRGAKANDYTKGVICSKVANYAERIHHRERLNEPLKRVGKKGSGDFISISWDEALDRIADEFKTASDDFGAESVWPYYYAGTMGLVQRDGIIRLQNAAGYSGMLKSYCTLIAYTGWTAGVGAVRGADPREIANSDLIVIWGCNAVATQINLMKHVALAQRERGATLVVVDPCRTGTARKADIHLALKPGTDGALAAAMMHVAFRDGYADQDYMQRMSDDPQGLKTSLANKTPQWAANITGLPVEQIEQIASLYGKTKRSFIRLGIGFSRSRNGASNVHAVSCLPVVTGAWQHAGGGALLATSAIFSGIDKSLIEGTKLAKSPTRVLDMARLGAILKGDKTDLKGGPPVKAMLIQSTNPMAVAPDLQAVREGFEREDLFVCVHEQFMTDTARMADIVLPATASVEHHDVYTSYGQTYLQLAEPVIKPHPNTRSNHEVICAIAQRLGFVDESFKMSAQQLIEKTLANSPYPSYQQLQKSKWFDSAKLDIDFNFSQGFDWPDKKFRFKADWSTVGEHTHGMPSWPDHWDVTRSISSETPFRLTTPPARRFLNSSFTQSLSSTSKEGRPFLRMHPTDAKFSQLQDGQKVMIGNSLGRVTLHLQITSDVLIGHLEARGVWPADAHIGKIGINSLISAQAVQPAGGVSYHDAAVWVQSA